MRRGYVRMPKRMRQGKGNYYNDGTCSIDNSENPKKKKPQEGLGKSKKT